MDHPPLGHYHEKHLLHQRQEIEGKIAALDKEVAVLEEQIRLIEFGAGVNVEYDMTELTARLGKLTKERDALTRKLVKSGFLEPER